MKLLILTQYFPPETGAPQNRLFELALRLQDKGIEIEVLTAMPNYPKMEIFPAYKGKKYVKEELEGLTIHRTGIYVSQSKGIVKRLLNYFSFVHTSWKRGRKLGEFDYILCESPPLFLGYTAMSLAKKLKAKLIFNVSDLWPESAEKLGLVTNKLFLKMAYKLEAKCYKKSYLITGQTQGIVKDIKDRFPDKNVYWLPNGVDLKNYHPEKVVKSGFRAKYQIPAHNKVIFYGGIIGHAQGLELIVNAAERFKDREDLTWVLLGSGPVKSDLEKLSQEKGLSNLIFAEPVARTEMGGVISEIDISLIPLRKLDLFKGAIPSKIFEILAMEKPIILGVEGEAKDLFISEGKAGIAYEPENLDDLERAVNELTADASKMIALGKNGRQYVDQKFNRDKIAAAFYEHLTNLEQ